MLVKETPFIYDCCEDLSERSSDLTIRRAVFVFIRQTCTGKRTIGWEFVK